MTKQADERLYSLDILRGFALCFMILVHFHQLMRADGGTGIDDLVAWAVWVLVETKAWGVFALLFGAGFALLLRRLDARGERVVPIYLRRLATLAAIGLLMEYAIHFQILRTYATWGVALLLIRRWSTKSLVAVALVSAMARSIVGAGLALYWHAAGLAPHGSWSGPVPLPDSNLSLFVLGLLAVRHGVFDEPLRHVRLIRGVMIAGATAWALSWLVLYRVPEELPIRGLSIPVHMGFGIIYDQWLCLTYAGGVLLALAYRPVLVRRLSWVGSAGRMALTNYVAQAVVIFTLATPLHVRIHETMYAPATAAMFGAEVLWSRFWLARFRFGPLEWLWRMATYWRWEPLRRPVGDALWQSPQSSISGVPACD